MPFAGVLAYLSRRKEAMGTEEMPEEMDDATSKVHDFDINSVKMHQKFRCIGYGLVTLVSENDEDSLVPSMPS